MEHAIKIKNSEVVYGWLTTNSPMSHYGIPALRLAEQFDDANRTTDYGPADLISHGDGAELFGPEPAAAVIVRWVDGQRETLTSEAIEAARRFCSQWVDGPQID